MNMVPFDFTYSSLAFLFHMESLPFTLNKVRRILGGRRDSDDYVFVDSRAGSGLSYVTSIERGRTGLPSKESWTEDAAENARTYSWDRQGGCLVVEELSPKASDCTVAIRDHAAPLGEADPQVVMPINFDGLMAGQFDELLYSDMATPARREGTFHPAPDSFDSLKLSEKAAIRLLHYDSDGRLVTITLPGLGMAFTFTWEGAFMIRCTAPGFLARFSYDSQGRLVLDERKVSESFLSSYCRSSKEACQERYRWSYSYDGAGRLIAVMGENPETSVSLSYGPFGSMSGVFERVKLVGKHVRVERKRLLSIGPYSVAENLEPSEPHRESIRYLSIRGGQERGAAKHASRDVESRKLLVGGRGFYRWQLKRGHDGRITSEYVSFVDELGAEPTELLSVQYCRGHGSRTKAAATLKT